MSAKDLASYCRSKIHPLFHESDVKKIKIMPKYKRSDAVISNTEKTDKKFNFKRPTASIEHGVGTLYVFPGHNYVDHYKKIYEHMGYSVEAEYPDSQDIDSTVSRTMPSDLPEYSDVIVLGYVEPLAGENDWSGNDDIEWKQINIEGSKTTFIGVKYSYWGDIIYHVISYLASRTNRIIYAGKLGSLAEEDVPNMTIATGDSSVVDGETISWNNLFASSPIVVKGAHCSLPSVLDETHAWFDKHKNTIRFVDPEIGWAAKSCRDNDIQFSYLHLVTDNLHGDFLENLTNERDAKVLEKRMQYVGIIKAIIWHAIIQDKTAIYPAILNAQQQRVDRGLMRPLQRDWAACLSFSYHTQEEAWEVVRELPRREWKDQAVDPERVLSEMADTQIQLMTALTYAGFNEVDLNDAVMEKLGAKRPDWK